MSEQTVRLSGTYTEGTVAIVTGTFLRPLLQKIHGKAAMATSRQYELTTQEVEKLMHAPTNQQTGGL